MQQRTVAAGGLLGFLVPLTSVGAEALGVVMLVYLFPYRLTPPKLVGADIAHAIPLTLVAGLGDKGLGNIDFAPLSSLLISCRDRRAIRLSLRSTLLT